jgi:hypothetical protein
VIKVLILLECGEGDRAIDLLEIAEPEKKRKEKRKTMSVTRMESTVRIYR